MPIDSSTNFNVWPLVKSNSTTLLGEFEEADAISVPFKNKRTTPVVQQFPKSTLPRPFPNNVVSFEPNCREF